MLEYLLSKLILTPLTGCKMTDIAQLGFMVNTSGLTRGQTAMGGYARTGRKMEKEVVGSVSSINKSFLSLNKAIGTVAATFAILAAGNFILDAGKSTNSFTQSLADLSAITGALGEDLEFYREQAAQIGRTTSLSASQAVIAFKLIASAKPDLLASAEALNAVTREAVTLAEATGIALPAAASALGSALNQFGLDASKASEVINILAASSKLGTAEVSSVTESLKNSGSAARSLGIDLTETVAGIQALAKAGILGAEAGTALRQVLLRLEKTNDQTLMPSINGLVASLNELKSRNLDNIQLMKLFGDEAFSAATSILSQSETVEQLNRTLRGTSVATEQASIRMNTLTGDLLGLGSAVEGLQIAVLVGDMNEFNRSLVQLSTGVINSLTENIEALSDAGLIFATVYGISAVAALGKFVTANVIKISSDIAAEKSTVAGIIAEREKELSSAKAAATITKSELSIAQARVTNTKFTISQFSAEFELEKLRFESQISQTGRTQSAVRFSQIQIAKIAITKQLSIAEAELSIASATATKAQATQAVATTVLAKTQVAATLTTRAFGVATRFLLGPWGLLITALGFAAAAFITTKDASKILREENEKSLASVDKLTLKFENFSRARLGALSVQAQEKAILIDQKRIDINERLNNTLENAPNSFAVIESLQNQLSMLNDESRVQEEILTAVGVLFDSWLPKLTEAKEKTDDLTGSTNALTDAQKKTEQAFIDQITSIRLQTAELVMSAEAFEMFAFHQNAIANKFTPEMTSALLLELIALQKIRKELNVQEELTESMKELTDQVDNFGGAWSRSGSIIVDAFGDISNSLNDYMKEIKTLDKLQTGIDKNRKIAGADQIQLDKLQKRVDLDRVGAELRGIKTLSSAGASLFDEKTGAAKAFSALNKIITVAEIALSFQKIAASSTETASHVLNETTKQGANALTAITSAFSAPPPVNFIAGAAMIGIMASLLGGAFGGGGSVEDPTEARQASQGTGTVLGSADKSQSLSNAQERFEDIAIDQLGELRGIKSSIDAQSLAIEKLATNIAGGGIGSFSGQTGVTSQSLGGLFSKTTKKVIDEGISFVSQTLGSILKNGTVQAQAFFDVETKKKSFFGLSSSSKLSTERQDINNAIEQQIGAIFQNIGDTVLQSAMLLGFETVNVLERSASSIEEFDFDKFGKIIRGGFETSLEIVELDLEDALSRFSVNIGEVSLEGLSGQEIQQELQAVFSQQADLIAEFLVPGIEQYQRISEGLFDTLLRVTKEQAIFNDNIERMGISLSEVSNIIKIDIAQSIISLTGGLENFNDLSQSFFDNFFSDAEKFEALEASLTDVFDSLGLPFVKTIDGFRDLIEELDITTAADQELFASLLSINPALSEFINNLADLEKEQESIREQQINSARDAASQSFSILKESISLERQRVQAIFDVAREAHSSELDRISSLRSTLEEENKLRKQALSNAESILTASFNSEKSIIQENATARINSLNRERDAISSTASAMTSLISNITSAIGLQGVDLVSALAAAQRGDFSQAQSLNFGALTNLSASDFSTAEDLAFQQAVNQNRLLQISELAKRQLSGSQLQLRAIDRQISLTQQSANNQIKALDDQLKSLLGIDESVISLNESISSFQAAQLSLDSLNFEVESEKLDLLKESADDVFNLHEVSYKEQKGQLDSIIETNNELLKTSLNINNSVLTIPVAVEALKAEIIKLQEETVFYLKETANNTQTSAEADKQAKDIGIKVSIIE